MAAKKPPAVPPRQPMVWTPLRLFTVIATVAAALAIFPAWWTFSAHWMNRDEIERASKAIADESKASNEKQDAAFKSHQQSDNTRQMWNAFGFADTRRQFLEDHKAECDAKRMMLSKLPPVDAAMCTRYEAQLVQKQQETTELKNKALEASKEKQ